MTETTVPAGYWQDAQGSLVPVAKIKEIDKDRHHTVTKLCEQAKKVSATMAGFKLVAMEAVAAFIDRSLAQYDAKHGGKKGNVTLVSFDGRWKIQRHVSDNIVFGEQLQGAKVLIDECIHIWSKGSNNNIKVLINSAFQVDKAGHVNKERVLGLRALNIEDEKWLLAMQAISDSLKVVSTKSYIRFYERVEATGEYSPISLDVAAL